jgi:hypothetical protein
MSVRKKLARYSLMAGVKSATSRKWTPSAFVPAARQAAHHRQRPAADGHQLLLGVEPVGREVLDAGPVLLQQRGQADHEELVQVGAADAQELDPLEERMRRVPGLGEHALIELEPRQLAVQVERRVREVGRIDAAPVGGQDHRRHLLAAAAGPALAGHAVTRADVRDTRVLGPEQGRISFVHEHRNLAELCDESVSTGGPRP